MADPNSPTGDTPTIEDAATDCGTATNRPNVLVITCHDLGRHLGCYGRGAETPALDGLADEGARFEDSVCVAPQCSPSRAAMFTGRYPHQNGVMGLTHGEFAWDLDDGERHLAGILGDSGWHTAAVGVQHATRRPEAFFDETALAANDCEDVASEAINVLDKRADADAPVYLQAGFFEPHRRPDTESGFGEVPDDHDATAPVPEYLADEASASEEFAAFEGAVRRVDAAIGRVLDELEQAGVAEETLVVSTTDHGIPFPRAKCSPYDPGLATALLLRWPDGPVPAGATFDEPIPNVDYLPTLLDLADVSTPEPVEGRSFAPLLAGDDYRSREAIFGELTYHDYPDPRRWVRTEEHKLIVNFSNAPFFMDPSQTWRPETVTRDPANPALAYHPPIECYDLRADPGETDNLADDPEYASVREDLLDQLHGWMVATDDPLLNGIPDSPMHDRAIDALEDGTDDR